LLRFLAGVPIKHYPANYLGQQPGMAISDKVSIS